MMKKMLAILLLLGLTTVNFADDTTPVRSILPEEYVALYAENHSPSPENARSQMEQTVRAATQGRSEAEVFCVEISGRASDFPFTVEYGARGLLVEDGRKAVFLPGSWETFSGSAVPSVNCELSRENILLRTDTSDKVVITYTGHASVGRSLPSQAFGLGWSGGRLLYSGTTAGRSGLFFPTASRFRSVSLDGVGLKYSRSLKGVLIASPEQSAD
ncbi:MAG: hypothetical protein KH009_02510 [Clostridiales bacterium]|nr:hypothetical protein [Clostridiales bacterium]